MNIKTVIFDMGGTLEDVHYNREIRRRAFPALAETMRRGGVFLPWDPESVLDMVLAGNARYKSWSEKQGVELPSLDIWADWNLRDFNVARTTLEPIEEELSYLWETTFFARELRPDARSTLEALKARGYQLGVISNTSSATQVFRTLEAYGIASFFECVILSSLEGVRKPAKAIFDAALAALGAEAESSAYVGDTLSRDVLGSKNAGYGLSIQIKSFLTAGSDAAIDPDAIKPDYLVGTLGEIVGVLDGLKGRFAR
jgi:putative hydrolase of the HAD superfamily